MNNHTFFTFRKTNMTTKKSNQFEDVSSNCKMVIFDWASEPIFPRKLRATPRALAHPETAIPRQRQLWKESNL